MKRTVTVIQSIEVEIDERKFDREFMEEFRRSFYDFSTIDAHIEHLAQMYARGITNPDLADGDFIEGYGKPEEMGIKLKFLDLEVEIL